MADKTMGELDAATLPLMTGDQIAVSRGGTATRRATIQNILDVIGAGSGDVVGPASATDNTLPRFSGTSGKVIQGSGIEVDDDNKISGYLAKKRTVSTDTDTLLASDTGKIVVYTFGGAIAATLPNDLPIDWCCTVLVTAGNGVITFSAEAGGLLQNRQGHSKNAGQFAMMTLYCVSNSDGSSAVVVLAGDTAA